MTKATGENSDIILIVEDTKANYDIIKTFLNDIDIKCENAIDGIHAVTMCSSVPKDYYSLILMDINLPYMDGFETTDKIRDIGIKIPIIAVTATSREEAVMKHADQIFDSVLFKPFNYLELYAVISPYIKKAMAYTLKLEESFSDENRFSAVDLSVCDVHKAVANMGNSPRLFIKHFNNFKSNNVDLTKRLRDMLKESCYTEGEMLCHSIKGIAGMLGLQSLYSHIIDLELCFKNAVGMVNISEPSDPDGLHSLNDVKDKIYGMLTVIDNDIRLICQIQF